MIRIKATYRNQRLELEKPLNLADDTRVEIEVRTVDSDEHKEAWSNLGMDRLESEWTHAGDAVYDDWKKLYGI